MSRVSALFLNLVALAVAPLTLSLSPITAAEPFLFKRVGRELHQFGSAYGGDGSSDHISMPGLFVGFRYSGKGPLPEPAELVIPMDRSLPLGTVCRLYVKNFHQGRMEATLGDITKPLRMNRFDWTVGETFEPNSVFDNIVLRYFPSRIIADTGAAQEELYIVQGVFLTTDLNKIPVRGGEVVDLLPLKPPAGRAGNQVRNGSFEVGLAGWGKRFASGYLFNHEDLDHKQAADGSTSLQLRAGKAGVYGIETPMMRVPSGKYTLSFQARAEGDVTLRALVQGMAESLKDYGSAGLAIDVRPNGKWQRYTVRGDLAPLPAFLYTVGFDAVTAAEDQAEGRVWIDAVELVAEDAPSGDRPFRPRDAVEIGWKSAVPGHIYFSGDKDQPTEVELLVDRVADDANSSQRIPISFQTFDFWGDEVDRGEISVDASGRIGKATAPLFSARQGIFRTLFKSGASESEISYSVVPANLHLTSLVPSGTLAIDGHLEPRGLAILKRANINWVLSKMLARWENVEPKQGGTMNFFDAELETARQQGISVTLQILGVYHPEWVQPHKLPAGGAAWKPEHRQAFLDAWESYVGRLVSHYKGKVPYWEIENEPNAAYPPAVYGEMLGRASKAIRAADPQAKILAMSGGGFEVPFYREATEAAGGPTAYDALSVHLYGSDPKTHRAFAELCAEYGKPGWNTETGATNPTFYTTLPTFEEFRRTGVQAEVQQAVRTHAMTDLRNYLTSLSHGRMERYVYYFARFGNASPSQPARWAGNGKELCEYDGSLRANAVSLCIASHFLDGAKYIDQAELDGPLEIHRFEKDGNSVGFIWAVGDELLIESSADSPLVLYDVMGNRTPKVTLSHGAPAYFRFDGNGKAVIDHLKALRTR